MTCLQRSTTSTPYHQWSAYHELIASVDVCTLTSRGPDGSFNSRVMNVHEYGGGHSLWFVTERASRKVEEIQANPFVSLSFTRPETGESATFTATARVIDADARVQRWLSPSRTQWLAAGDAANDSAETQSRLALIEVQLVRVNYLQAQPRSRASWFQFTRALVAEHAVFESFAPTALSA